jgi:predicted  nucleic acid-binding Zn-ribbon protein
MAITVGDALLKLGINFGSWDSDMTKLNADLKGLQEQSKNTALASAQLTKIGVGITAFGAGLAAALGFAVKGAADEEATMIRLSGTLKNIGISYESVKGSLDKFIMATEKATAVNHDKLYASLTQLISITGDYDKAQRLLPIALDLAAHANIDLSTATDVVAKASTGVARNLAAYGIQVKAGASATEILAAIQKASAGSAEAYGKSTAGAMEQVKNALGELMDSIGSVLLPIMKKVAEIVSSLINWFNKLPSLVKTAAVIVAALAAGLALVGGSTLLLLGMFPTLTAGVATLGAVFHVALGPIGLVSLAIMGIIAAGVALWHYWDKVVGWWEDTWSKMKQSVFEACKAILDGLSTITRFIPGLGSQVDKAREKLSAMIDAEKISRDARAAGVAISGTTDEMKAAVAAAKDYAKKEQDLTDALEDNTAQQEKVTADLKDAQDLYTHTSDNAAGFKDEIDDLTGTLKTQKKDLADAETELGKLKTVYDDAKKKVNDLEDAISAANRRLKELSSPRLEGMQKTEDAIQALQEQINPLLTQRIQIQIAGGDTEVIDAQIRALELQQDLLRSQAEEIYQPQLYKLKEDVEEIQGENKETIFGTALAEITDLGVKLTGPGGLYEQLKSANTELGTATTELDKQKTKVEGYATAVDTTQTSLDALNDKVATILKTQSDGILVLKNNLFDLNQAAKDLQTTLDGVKTAAEAAARARANIPNVPAPTSPTEIPGYGAYVTPAQHGGIAMKPTLALIGEQAPRVPEVVAPLDRLLDIFRVALSPLSQAMLAPAAGGGGDITVNISGNNFTIREEADIERVGRKMVDLIRLRQGLRV